MKSAMLAVLTAGGALAAGMIPGDARRGEQLFQTQQCIRCHSLKGRGGAIAPDLGRHIDRGYTPTIMASLMWDHAPEMWQTMQRYGIGRAGMDPQRAAGSIRLFVSAR